MSELAKEENIEKDSNTQKININEITPDPSQPRKFFNEDSINELSQSILRHGLLQPIVVYFKENKYIIVAGERRYRALIKANITEVPVKIIKFKEEDEKLELSLIENIQREDLNPLEIAQSIQSLLNQSKNTQVEIAKQIGKSRSYVANMIRLLNLPLSIQEEIRNGNISYGHAKALMSSDSPENYIKDVVEKKIPVRELEKIIRKEKKEPDQDLEYIRYTIEKLLNLKTKIDIKSNGTGSITFDFNNVESLDNLIEVLRNYSSSTIST